MGRGTAPVHFDIQKLQKELADLREVILKKEKKKFKIDPDVRDQGSDLGFYEALKRSRNKPGTYDNFHADISSQKRKTLPEKIVEPKVIPKEKAAHGFRKTKTNDPFTIQVAALKDALLADKMTAQLKKKGYPAYRVFVQIPDKGIWYRIRVGVFQNRDEAQSTLNRLKKEIESKTSAKVVIWLGSCYGACDVPLHIKKLGVDLLIQWGHSKFK